MSRLVTVSRMRFAFVPALACALCLGGCHLAHERADVDAGPRDGGRDASLDARMPRDALPDTPDLRDALPDAPLCECPLLPECLEAVCEPGGCVAVQRPDGTPCSDGECLGGMCVPPTSACGDGVRIGAGSPLREGCDDGNRVEGDACDAECVPTPFTIAGAADRALEPDLDVDGSGTVLVAWVARGAGRARIEAARFRADGVALDAAPIVVSAEPLREDLGYEPTVAGLAGGGWAVAWSQFDGTDGPGSRDLAYALVAADGAAAPPRPGSEIDAVDQLGPRAARVGDGFVIVWRSAHEPGGSHAYARLFDRAGEPRGAAFRVSEGLSEDADADVAGAGDRWVVLHQRIVSVRSEMHLRRYADAMPLDATSIVVESARALAPYAAATEASALVAFAIAGSPDVRATSGGWTGPLGTLATFGRGNPDDVVAIAPAPGGYVLVWARDTRRGLALGSSAGVSMVPEASLMLDAARNATVRFPGAVATERGLFVVWDDVERGRVTGFVLPRD